MRLRRSGGLTMSMTRPKTIISVSWTLEQLLKNSKDATFEA